MSTKNDKVIIKRVWQVKATGAKLVTIPASADIEEGDHVRIEKVE